MKKTIQFKYILCLVSLAVVAPASFANGSQATLPAKFAPSDSISYIYVGVQGGMENARLSNTTDSYLYGDDMSPVTTKFDIDDVGGVGGVFLGYAYQNSDDFFLAAEIDAAGTTINKSTTVYADPTQDLIYKIREQNPWRVGFSILPGFAVDNALFYARLGAVYSKFQYNADNASVYGVSDKFDKYLWGARAGLGVLYNISANWAVRGEYDVTYYRNFNHDNTANFDVLGDIKQKIRISPMSQTAMVGVMYKFNLGATTTRQGK